MSEPVMVPGDGYAGTSPTDAGRLLREAREARGLPIEELAAMLKVTPRKLEILEAGQFDQFPDPVFVRALSQSVCRSLKIDAAPVLALLPQTPTKRLDQLHVGLNAPFRERPTQMIPDDLSGAAKPWVWAPALLLVAAALVYFFPSDWLGPPKISPRASDTAAAPATATTGVADVRVESPAPLAPRDQAVPAASSLSVVVSAAPASGLAVSPASPAAAPVLQTPAADALAAVPRSPLTIAAAAPSAPPATLAVAAAQAPIPVAAGEKAAAPVSGVLQFRATADSWIEVQDASGKFLLSRGLQAGEAVGVNGAMPMAVTIGNVRGTQVNFRGKSMDLALFTRGNIAKFELK